jgi:hypothetical protein
MKKLAFAVALTVSALTSTDGRLRQQQWLSGAHPIKSPRVAVPDGAAAVSVSPPHAYHRLPYNAVRAFRTQGEKQWQFSI